MMRHMWKHVVNDIIKRTVVYVNRFPFLFNFNLVTANVFTHFFKVVTLR